MPDPTEHHIIGYNAGISFPRDWAPEQRRREGLRLGWTAERSARWAADPDAEEFAGPHADLDTDALLPMDKLWEWIADLRAGIMRRPFTVPRDYGRPAEPEGDDPDCE